MRRMIALEVALLICAICVAMPLPASAGDTTKRCGKTGKCYVMAKEHRKARVDRKITAGQPRAATRQNSGNHHVRHALKKFSAALADYDRQLARYNRCVLTFDPSSNPAGCGSMPTAPNAPQFGTEAFNRPGNPAITAGQAAAIAVARLQLPTVAPGIGPSPELNPWKIAAVGYPLWLWADGPTHIGPVSDAVAGLSVSLDAKVSSITFRMGDGHSITCSGSGHRWTTAVEPGTKSPSCGYSYGQPSVPDRNYTVAAITNWAVTWTSNGQSGVINVPAIETTELPVGELQVLVR
jgi:hypothetical protein